MYERVALDCIRYLGFKSFEEIDKLTIPQYELMMKAVRLRETDKDYRSHLQAFLNFSVKAEKKSGKKSVPVYRNFKKFYNYEREIAKILHPDKYKERLRNLGRMLSRKEN